MESSSNVIAPPTVAASARRDELRGLALATLGVAIFSFSLPATRLAVADLDPMFVAFGRAAVAAVLAAIVLRALRAPRPSRAQWRSLAIIAFGVVVGFPLLTALALRDVDATHGAVVIALLPACTAVFAVLRAGEYPARGFWLAAGFGLVAVLAFIASRGVGAIGSPTSSCSSAPSCARSPTPRAARCRARSAARRRSAGRCCSRCRSASR